MKPVQRWLFWICMLILSLLAAITPSAAQAAPVGSVTIQGFFRPYTGVMAMDNAAMVTVPEGAPYEIESVWWTANGDPDHHYSAAFASGVRYSLTIGLKSAAGYSFTGAVSAHIEGLDAVDRYNTHETVTLVNGKLWIQTEFLLASEPPVIDRIHIYGYREPVVGETPPESVPLTVEEGANYRITEAWWMNSLGERFRTPFAVNKQYLLCIEFEVIEPAVLPNQTSVRIQIDDGTLIRDFDQQFPVEKDTFGLVFRIWARRPVAIDAAHFPDATFRSFVGRYDLNNDGSLDNNEISKVREMDVSGLRIRSLRGIGNFAYLTRLNCENNLLTEETFPSGLTWIDCSDNPDLVSAAFSSASILKHLDLSNTNSEGKGFYAGHFPVLEWLDVSGSGYYEVLLYGCPALVSTYLNGISSEQGNGILRFTNGSSCLIVDKNLQTSHKIVAVQNAEGIPINEYNFPDADFRDYICQNYDRNGNDYLSESEIAQATAMETSATYYYGLFDDLTGIEYLTALRTLEIPDQNLTGKELNLNRNSSLQYVNVEDCGLAALHVESLSGLETLNAGGNQLEQLDISGCPVLEELFVGNNPDLFYLRTGTHESLKVLYADSTGLDQLDFSEIPQLRWVVENCQVQHYAAYDQYQDANHHVTVLKDCFFFGVTAVPVTAETFSDDVFCEYVAEHIDTSGNGYLGTNEIRAVKELEAVDYGFSSVSGIEVFRYLTYLNLESNLLTSVDVSGLPLLKELYLGSNPLETVIGGNQRLTELSLRETSLTDWSGLSGFWEVDKLDLSGCRLTNDRMEAVLDAIGRAGLILLGLDVSGNPQLTQLNLYAHTRLWDLFSLDVSNCGLVKLSFEPYCLHHLDIHGNPNLKQVFVGDPENSPVAAAVVRGSRTVSGGKVTYNYGDSWSVVKADSSTMLVTLTNYDNGMVSDYFALPDSLTAIEESAFENCRTEVILVPSDVTEIGNRAFAGSDVLRFVRLPSGLSAGAIAGDAFADSPNVSIIGVSGSGAETYALQNGIPFIPNSFFGDPSGSNG